MRFRSLILATGLLAAVPAFAQAPSPQAAQNATNWNIFQKLYPPRAVKAREEGLVGFRVTIDAKGAVTGCQITQSSGHPLLDQETCKIITLNAEFQPEPGLSGSQVRTREGMIDWQLPDSKAAPAAPQQLASASELDKVVCKKSIKTGTIAGAERTCMTVREWARMSDEERATWREIEGKGFTRGN